MIEIGYVVTLVFVGIGAMLIHAGKNKQKERIMIEENLQKMDLFTKNKERWNKDHQNVITYRMHEGESFTMHQRKRNEFRITFFIETGIQWSICLKGNEFFKKNQIEIVGDYYGFLSYLKRDEITWLQFQDWVCGMKKTYHQKIQDNEKFEELYINKKEKAKQVVKQIQSEKQKETKIHTDHKELLEQAIRMKVEKNKITNPSLFQNILENMKKIQRQGVHLTTEEYHLINQTFPKDLRELQMMYDGLDEKGKENMKEQIEQTKLYMEKVLHEIEGQVRERKTTEMKIK